VGVSAGYAPLALGTESVGSIVMPACRAGLYALKPTLNSVYMDGVFKTSAELDVVGGLTRSASDLATLSYCALTQEKQDLLPKGGYHKYLTKNFDSLRIGFLDPTKWSLHPDIVQLDKVILQQMVRLRCVFPVFASTENFQNDMYVAMVDRVRDHAAETSVKYPVDLPPASDLWYEGRDPIDILVCEWKVLVLSSIRLSVPGSSDQHCVSPELRIDRK
jgi:amidase